MTGLTRVFSAFMTFFIKIELNILYFFTMNRFGYVVYCYLVCVYVFGRKIENPDPYEQGFILLAFLIILEVIGMSLFFFIVLRFQSGRDLIYSYVPRAYVISCIGNPGHRAILGSLGALLAVTSLDLFQQAGQGWVNKYNTQNYIDMCRESGQPTKDHIVEDLLLTRTDTGAKLGRIVIEPGSAAARIIMEKVQPPTPP
jgi:hypothetical protein